MEDQFSKIRFAALCLTHNCNLRCRYCYAGDKSDCRMTAETGRQAIDFLAERSNGQCAVTFFGGEPLMELELMKGLIAYSRERHGRSLQFRMSTNGTLLNDETIAYLKANDVFFALSLDGHRRQHDTLRTFADGRGSFDRIERNLEAIFEFNPYTVAVSVVMPETAGYMADGAKSLFDRGFRYVLQTLDYSAPWEEADLAVLKKQYSELAKFYYDSLEAGRKIYYSPFDERIRSHAQKPHEKGDQCDLANSQIAIAASGTVYPCVQFVGSDDDQARANTIGHVATGFDDNRRRYYIDENYREKQPCADCALNGRCANYCGCVNWQATGSLCTIPPIICEHERMLMPIVDRMANKLWKKNVALFKRKFYDPAFPISSYMEDCLVGRGNSNA